MKRGFTGTRDGMTEPQLAAVILLCTVKFENTGEFHHGACVGADSQLHNLVVENHSARIVIHPPTDTRYANVFEESERVEILPPKPYLQRNADIVDATDELIATPKEFEEQIRGGTWWTVRYARKQGKKVWLVLPDGTVDEIN